MSYFVLQDNFQVQAPGPRAGGEGGLYLEGRFNERFFALRVWGAYIWRGLFSEFYGMLRGGYFIGGTVPTEPSAGGKIFQPVENTSSAVWTGLSFKITLLRLVLACENIRFSSFFAGFH